MRFKEQLVSFVILVALGACTAPTDETVEQQGPQLAEECNLEPELCPGGGGGEEPPPPSYDTYVVMMSGSAPQTAPSTLAASTVASYGGSILSTFGGLRGFVIRTTEDGADQLRASPNVVAVALNTTFQGISGTAVAYTPTTQTDPNWGQDRIDQRALPLNGTYTYNGTGQGVRAYLLDTGIRPTHAEFGGRVTLGPNFASDGTDARDCNGHGTMMAGLIGGTRYGVAKAVALTSVRMMNCNGVLDLVGATKAVDWVVANGQRPAVVVFAWHAWVYSNEVEQANAFRAAIDQMIDRGFVVVASNGEEDVECPWYVPANYEEVITVGATKPQDDSKDPYSDYGACIDIWAPGTMLFTAAPNSDAGFSYWQYGGTPAAAVTAGAAALWLGNHPTATHLEVRGEMIAAATPLDLVIYPGATQSIGLLYVGPGFGSGDDEQPPIAVIDGGISTLPNPTHPTWPWVRLRSIDVTSEGSSDDIGITSRAWRLCPDATPTTCLTSTSTQWVTGSVESQLPFTLTLTVTDMGGHSATASKHFTHLSWPVPQLPPPVVAVITNNSYGTGATARVLSVSGAASNVWYPVTSYAWTFCPNATPASCQTGNTESWVLNPATPHLPGTLTLTVTDGYGRTSATSQAFTAANWP